MKRDSIRSFVFALTFATASWLGTSAAAAQSLAEPRTWTVTPFLHTSLGEGIPDVDALDSLLESSVGVGVGVGYDLTHNLGFEGEIAHSFDVAGDSRDVDWSVTTFSANAIYHFDVKRVTPYATFGIGLERSNYDIDASDALDLQIDASANEVQVNFGGGVKYKLNDRWIARGDLRRFQANDIAPDFWRLYGGISWVVKR